MPVATDAAGFPVTRTPAGVARSARGARDLAGLDARVSGCRACPRLVVLVRGVAGLDVEHPWLLAGLEGRMGDGGRERLQARLGVREVVGGRGVLLESMEGIWVVQAVEVRVSGRHWRG